MLVTCLCRRVSAGVLVAGLGWIITLIIICSELRSPLVPNLVKQYCWCALFDVSRSALALTVMKLSGAFRKLSNCYEDARRRTFNTYTTAGGHARTLELLILHYAQLIAPCTRTLQKPSA